MYHAEVGQLVQAKEPIGESGYYKFRRSVKGGTLDLRIVLHEVMSLRYAPLGLHSVLYFRRLSRFHGRILPIAPLKQRAILANGIDLLLLLSYASTRLHFSPGLHFLDRSKTKPQRRSLDGLLMW